MVLDLHGQKHLYDYIERKAVAGDGWGYSHISMVWFGLVYWGLTPQQQPGSYQGGDDDDEISVSLVEETGAPRGNHRPTASN